MIYHMLDPNKVRSYNEMEWKLDLFTPIAKPMEVIKDPPGQQKNTASITVKYPVPVELHSGQIHIMSLLGQHASRIKFDYEDGAMCSQFIVENIWIEK